MRPAKPRRLAWGMLDDDRVSAQATAADYDRAMALDARLRVGMEVQARWQQTGHPYRGLGVVTSVAKRTVTVALSAQVQAVWGEPFPAGFEVLLPRPMSPRWSPTCGAFPT